jgi:hypothetical protein
VLRLASIGPVKAHVGPGALDSPRVGVNREMIWPAVIGLPGVVGALEEDVCGPFVTNDEDDVALPVRLFLLINERREPSDINAARPVLRNSEACAGFPEAFVDVFDTGFRNGLCFALKGSKRLDESRPSPAVIAQAENLDATGRPRGLARGRLSRTAHHDRR